MKRNVLQLVLIDKEEEKEGKVWQNGRGAAALGQAYRAGHFTVSDVGVGRQDTRAITALGRRYFLALMHFLTLHPLLSSSVVAVIHCYLHPLLAVFRWYMHSNIEKTQQTRKQSRPPGLVDEARYSLLRVQSTHGSASSSPGVSQRMPYKASDT